MNCLFLSPVVPYPPDSGGRIRTFRLLRELSGRARVHLWAVSESEQAAAAMEALRPFCASLRTFPRSAPGAWRRTTSPKVERWFHSDALRTALRQEWTAEKLDVLHLDEMFLVRALPPAISTPVCVHHHKLDAELYESLARAGDLGSGFDLFKLRRLEAESARRHRFHVLTSAGDARRLSARHAGLTTAVVENGFDPEYFRPPDGRAPPRDATRLLFMGSMDYGPNVDGLKWFVREVLPLVRAARPATTLEVVGRSPTDEVRALASPQVHVRGAVDDVRPHLHAAALLVVPLRVGGGTRIKIVEALGSETPVVSTSIGAEDLAFRAGEHLWIADGAGDFAHSVLEALEDPTAAARRAARGRDLALERYTWSRLADRLLDAWRDAARG